MTQQQIKERLDLYIDCWENMAKLVDGLSVNASEVLRLAITDLEQLRLMIEKKIDPFDGDYSLDFGDLPPKKGDHK